MDKKIQDLAWACLPKEVRDFIKSDTATAWQLAYARLFGEHNLTSNTEPEEMLITPRKQVLEYYKDVQQAIGEENGDTRVEMEGRKMAMRYFFGDKCLPDKEHNEDNFAKSESSVQGEPKFKVGDIVRVKCPPCKGEIGIIDEIGSRIIEYHLQGSKALENFWFAESDLEPYTESESRNLSQETANCDKPETNNQNDNMEKELNLCELLKGCEFGETFYSTLDGAVRFTGINSDKYQKPIMCAEAYFCADGKYQDKPEAACCLFPSRALYEKYPLDAYSAWMEWKESRKPKRWTPKDNEGYWFVNNLLNAVSSIFDEEELDDIARVDVGNCFQTQELARQAAEGVREYLLNFHQKNNKN